MSTDPKTCYNRRTQAKQMNTQIKQKWIDALRSGKYEQGSEKLRSGTGYCCLGVLCDLYSQEHNVKWEFIGNEETNLQPMDYWYFDGDSEFLPESVMNWAELKTHNPTLQVDVEDNDHEDGWCYEDGISGINDSGCTFSRIASLIEAHL
jgi:hypothetical protein